MGRSARDPQTGLTDKEEVFARNVALDPDCSLTEAYRRGYNCSRMKPETVNNKAHQLAKKDDIRARIAFLREQQLARVQYDKDKLLLRLVRELEADVSQLFTDAGELKGVADWPLSFRQGLVSGIDVESVTIGEGKKQKVTTRVSKIKLSDRTRQLKLVGDHVDVMAFKKQVEHSAEGDLLAAIADISDKNTGLPPPPPAREASK